jgi:hypothetical protein
MRQKNGRFSKNQWMGKEKIFCDFSFFLLSFAHICQKHSAFILGNGKSYKIYVCITPNL